MTRQQLNICYLTKKANAISPIIAILNPFFQKLTATQISSTLELKKEPDLIIADAEFGEITAECPVLRVVPPKNAAKYAKEGSMDFITEDEISSLAVVRVVKNILEREKLANSLKEATVSDPLTGLYNQRFLLDALSREVKKANRYCTALSLLYVGIDGLKKINEKYSHAAGDRMVIDFGLIIANAVREVDTVGRFMGDEFLAILPETTAADALKVCARIQHTVKNFAFGGGSPGLTITAGIGASSMGGRVRTKEILLEAARTALAGAKKRGNGSICSWEETARTSEPIEEDKKLITSLQHLITSITENTKKIHFQDIVRMLEDIHLYKKTVHHSERVAFYSERLASQMGMEPDELPTIKQAAFLHDIGKLAIDEHILMKEGPLSGTEFNLVKQHPVIAAQILGPSSLMKNAANIILHHHERFDGSGYPDGLRERHIPSGSRIIGLAEAWDTMITSQVYRDALPLDHALTELKKGSGKQFDPELVAVFARLIEG